MSEHKVQLKQHQGQSGRQQPGGAHLCRRVLQQGGILVCRRAVVAGREGDLGGDSDPGQQPPPVGRGVEYCHSCNADVGRGCNGRRVAAMWAKHIQQGIVLGVYGYVGRTDMFTMLAICSRCATDWSRLAGKSDTI